MTYSITLSDTAVKQLKKLERDVQERIISSLERYRIRPHHFAEKVVGSSYYRFRSGNYRIIADIKDESLVILVIGLGHRSTIYRFYEPRQKYGAKKRIKARI